MERHQAGQEEKLMEVKMEMDSLEGVHQSRGSPVDHCSCFKCVVALVVVMGLIIVALVLGFILHYFMFTPSCKQDAPPLRDTEKVNIACKLKESDKKGRYDIFTVEKSATYIIYGWVKLTDITSEEVILKNTFIQDSRTIQKKKSETKVSFLDTVKLVSKSRISIYFNASCTDSLFRVFEL